MMPLRWLLALVTVWLLAFSASAQGVQPVPALSGHVIDQTGTLSGAPQQALEAKLAAFETSHGAQVVVLVVASTQPEDISNYANRVANAWKIGRKGIGDGLLLIVAKNDRKLRIEVAKTLEGAIPDLAAKQIIDGAITPRFKQGDYAGGIDAGVEQILALIRGEGLPTPASTSTPSGAGDGLFQWDNLLVFLFFGVVLGGRLARAFLGNKLGSLATGSLVGWLVQMATASLAIGVVAGIVAALFTLISSLGWGGRGSGGFTSFGSGGGGWSSGGSSSGGGGFSSGGGGDFGGGGASGDW